MSPRPTCLVAGCPNPASGFRHHPTGKDAADRYLDPKFTAGFCHDHHELVHDDWHTHQIADGEDRSTFLEWLQLCLSRASVTVGRIAGPDPEDPLRVFLAELAAWLARAATDLGRAIDALDRTCPAWRQTPDV
jgi:hypothetical protein